MDFLHQKDSLKRVETYKNGVFKFQLGVGCQEIEVLFRRVQDAQERFKSSPLSSVANELEKEVVVSSVFGTNTIEGGELTEEETRQALSLSPSETQDIQQKRVLNIKRAYDFIREIAVTSDWNPSLQDVLEIHKQIYDGINDIEADPNKPGLLRDNPDGISTWVGDHAHGGQHKPPQNGRDVKLLLNELLAWNEMLANKEVPVLIRAPLFHLYFEIIHPFWDGNGRVGRVIEAGILYAEGFRYAPFAQANYYLKNIDSYFSLFNLCRKAANKKESSPNKAFITFFLEGMLQTINHLHDRVNDIVDLLLFQGYVKHLHDNKTINDRQNAIVIAVLDHGEALTLKALRQAAWYTALYAKLTAKTRSRDLQRLFDLGLLSKQEECLFPGFISNLPD